MGTARGTWLAETNVQRAADHRAAGASPRCDAAPGKAAAALHACSCRMPPAFSRRPGRPQATFRTLALVRPCKHNCANTSPRACGAHLHALKYANTST
eukprot:8019927-Lingulodinium_polyedra.AAC.1